MSFSMRVLLVGMAHTFLILSLIGINYWTLSTGREITVRTKALDPADLFEGAHTTFYYDIGEILLSDIDGDNDFRKWDTAYVVLKRIGDLWFAASIHTSFPETAPGELVIRGRVKQVEGDPGEYERTGALERITVLYGIEDHTISAESAEYFQSWLDTGTARIRIVVDSTGRALRLGIEAYPDLLDEPKLF